MKYDSSHNKTVITLTISAMCMLLFLSALATMFISDYRDPRWRIFNYTSRQATIDELYNVAEVPVISEVELIGERTLRISFLPEIAAKEWIVRSKKTGDIIHHGPKPEIPFTGEPSTDTYLLEPDGVTLDREIGITISFYPTEKYVESGLSWPDNYYSPHATVPFSRKRPWSLDEWTGFKPNDPDIAEARSIVGDYIDCNAPTLKKAERIFAFVMGKIKDSGGTPTNSLQSATPLETYRALSSGEKRGWCENRALVYYLFANAVGVKTRLVDVAGKIGPLKLTGHYFCESWDDKNCRWFLVDPMSSVAHVNGPDGRTLTTLEIKHLFDTGAIDACTASYYDADTGNIADGAIGRYAGGNRGYFTGDIVMAYKFGYAKNHGFSKLKHFASYPTLLYAPFALPRHYLLNRICLYGFLISLSISILSGIMARIGGKSSIHRSEQ